MAQSLFHKSSKIVLIAQVLTSAEYASWVSIYMPIISVHTVLQLNNALATAAQKTAMSETSTIRCPQSKSTYR
jgi:hypothetical protein